MYRQFEKENLINSDMLSLCLHNMANVGPCTTGWDRFGSLGHSSKFQRVSRLGFLTARRRRCLAVSWAATQNIYTLLEALVPWRNFARCQVHFASKSCVLLYILAALMHGTRVVGVSQTLQRWAEGATYIRQGGHHVRYRSTF